MRVQRGSRPAAIASAGLLSLGLIVSPLAAQATTTTGPTEHTDMGVSGDGVMEHLSELSDIAVANADGGFRALDTEGYEESGQYVEEVLEATGAFDVSRQYFEIESQTFDTVSLSVAGTDVTPVYTMSYAEGTNTSGDGPLTDTALVLPVDDTYGDGAGGELGCAATDYDDSAAGAIALVQRGTCTFGEKVAAASEAGAAGVIIYNNAEGPLNGTLGERMEDSAPAVGIELAAGESLREQIIEAAEEDPVTADLTVETEFAIVETFNVLAQTTAGDPDDVIMLGAHLDGVPEGPGVNDNASGVAGLLEVAEQIAAQPTEPDRQVRFGFWGAEEVGLVGSTHYVNDLVANDPAELDRISAYMNYDMIGSENYIVGTYDADASTYPIPDGVTVPEGSAELEQVLTDYFDGIDQPWVDTEYSGRSDYQAFIDNGIPSSGLFSGADDIKTEEEVELFGGTPGVQHDRFYHSADDTIENVSEESIGIFAPAIGYSTHVLAWDLVAAPPTDEPTTEPTVDPTTEPTADPTTEPTDDATDPATTAPATTAPAAAGGSDSDDSDTDASGALPRTGVDSMPLVGAALVLVLLGLVLTGATLRRNKSDADKE